jgi:hypothetical protein
VKAVKKKEEVAQKTPEPNKISFQLSSIPLDQISKRDTSKNKDLARPVLDVKPSKVVSKKPVNFLPEKIESTVLKKKLSPERKSSPASTVSSSLSTKSNTKNPHDLKLPITSVNLEKKLSPKLSSFPLEPPKTSISLDKKPSPEDGSKFFSPTPSLSTQSSIVAYDSDDSDDSEFDEGDVDMVHYRDDVAWVILDQVGDTDDIAGIKMFVMKFMYLYTYMKFSSFVIFCCVNICIFINNYH